MTYSFLVFWKSGWPESAILVALKFDVNFAEPSAPEPSPKQASRPSRHTNERRDRKHGFDATISHDKPHGLMDSPSTNYSLVTAREEPQPKRSSPTSEMSTD